VPDPKFPFLGGHFTRFESWVGVDAEMSGYKQSSVVFQIFGDGKKLFDSGIMRIDTPAKQAAADMHGVRELALVVTDAGDGIECDHADWADATLFADPAQIRGLTQPIADQTPKYEVRGGSLAVKLSADGDIVGARTRRRLRQRRRRSQRSRRQRPNREQATAKKELAARNGQIRKMLRQTVCRLRFFHDAVSIQA